LPIISFVNPPINYYPNTSDQCDKLKIKNRSYYVTFQLGRCRIKGKTNRSRCLAAERFRIIRFCLRI